MNFAADGEKEMAGWKQADAKAVTWERGCGGKGRKLYHRLKTLRYLRSEKVGGLNQGKGRGSRFTLVLFCFGLNQADAKAEEKGGVQHPHHICFGLNEADAKAKGKGGINKM